MMRTSKVSFALVWVELESKITHNGVHTETNKETRNLMAEVIDKCGDE